MIICLVVRVVNEDDETIGGYARELDLPFVPTVGMKFKCNGSTWLWETENSELDPEIKEVVYNIDEEKIYCLFKIEEFLDNSFWTEIPQEHIYNSLELNQFKTH